MNECSGIWGRAFLRICDLRLEDAIVLAALRSLVIDTSMEEV